VLLLAALYPLQFVLDALRARNLLRLTIAGLFLFSARRRRRSPWSRRRAPLAAWLVRRRGGGRGLRRPARSPWRCRRSAPSRRVRRLALLVRAAVAESRCRSVAADEPGSPTPGHLVRERRLIGWLDEAVQGILPNRMYDLSDVGFNALAAALALAAAAAMRATMAGAGVHEREPTGR
jgi:hypothetical protein